MVQIHLVCFFWNAGLAISPGHSGSFSWKRVFLDRRLGAKEGSLLPDKWLLLRDGGTTYCPNEAPKSLLLNLSVAKAGKYMFVSEKCIMPSHQYFQFKCKTGVFSGELDSTFPALRLGLGIAMLMTSA